MMRISPEQWRKISVINKPLITMLLATALAGFSLATHAKNVRKSLPPPPPKFDHFYEGSIKVRRDDSGIAPCRAKSLSSKLGCAYPPEEPGGECYVFLAWRRDIEESGYTEYAIWRQLMARCNGWKDYPSLIGKEY
jgi:hypothetical protein